MLFEWGMGMANGHQDEEEKERPQQLHQKLDLRGQNRLGEWRPMEGPWAAPSPAHPTGHYRLPLAIQEILPKQQHQLCPEGHGGNGQQTERRGQAEDVLCGCGQLPVPL